MRGIWDARTCWLLIRDSYHVPVRIRIPAAEVGQRNELEFSTQVSGGQEGLVVAHFCCGGQSQGYKRASYCSKNTGVSQRLHNLDVREFVASRCAKGIDISARAGGSQPNRGSKIGSRAAIRRSLDSSRVFASWQRAPAQLECFKPHLHVRR